MGIEIKILNEIHEINIDRVLDTKNSYNQKTKTILLCKDSDLSRRIADDIRREKSEEIQKEIKAKILPTKIKKLGRENITTLVILLGNLDDGNGYDKETIERANQKAWEIAEEFDIRIHPEVMRGSGLSHYM